MRDTHVGSCESSRSRSKGQLRTRSSVKQHFTLVQRLRLARLAMDKQRRLYNTLASQESQHMVEYQNRTIPEPQPGHSRLPGLMNLTPQDLRTRGRSPRGRLSKSSRTMSHDSRKHLIEHQPNGTRAIIFSLEGRSPLHNAHPSVRPAKGMHRPGTRCRCTVRCQRAGGHDGMQLQHQRSGIDR